MKQNSSSPTDPNWQSPVTAERISAGFRFADLQWDNATGTLVWMEGRSSRNVLVCQPRGWGGRYDLTRQIGPRAQVGYGGGDFTVWNGTVYFVSGQTLYRQPLASTDPVPLLECDREIASPAVSPDGRWIVLVTSTEQKDTVSIIQNESGAPIVDLFDDDFCMQPTWHPNGNRLAWVSWKHPKMPWDDSSIHLGSVDFATGVPTLEEDIQLADRFPSGGARFQPLFSPDGQYLSFISDHAGWSNLHVYSIAGRRIVHSFSEEAEHAPPPWVQGMRSAVWSPDSLKIFAIRNRTGFNRLVEMDLESQSIRELNGETGAYSSFSQLSLNPVDGSLAAIASSSSRPASIIVTSPKAEVAIGRISVADPVPDEYCSPYEHLSWTDETGQTCHGLFSPPQNPDAQVQPHPPLVIKIHGGPTSQYAAEYEPDTLFFTTRGFAVLALNYRGSTGYGRDYRESLRESWGESDVEDVRSAFEFLKATGRCDPQTAILAGGSAGGFTVLLALARFPGIFRAAICRYGVADLLALTEETHKFEAHYLDSLIGTLPEHRDRYIERSPISHFERIVDPVAVFQGEDDPVVPKQQSEALVASLREREVPHVYRLYPGEKHGWRKKETIRDYYQTIEEFLKKFARQPDRLQHSPPTVNGR